MPVVWHDRSQYANILKDVIQWQREEYNKTRQAREKNKVAQSIAYCISVMASLINQERNIEKRIEMLERSMEISQKLEKAR